MQDKIEFSTIPPESKQPDFKFNENILDVKLFRDPDSQYILIGFDLISKSANFNKLPLNLKRHLDLTTSLDERILKRVWDKAAEEEITFSSSEYILDIVVDQKSQWKFPKKSIYYQLPTNPKAALNWLGAFVMYLNQDAGNCCIHFKEYTNDNSDVHFYQGVTEVDCIDDYQNKNDLNATIHNVLIEAILSLKNDDSLDCYAEAMPAIETIYRKYNDDRAKGKSIRFTGYVSPIDYLYINNEEAIQRLLKEAIDKPAHDGGRYNKRYTEFQFLRSAFFSMTADGKLSITDLDKNPAYEKYYAPGKKNHEIFEPELRFLAKILGLGFEENDFNESGIIFDLDSSQKLLKTYRIICIEDEFMQGLGGNFNNSNPNNTDPVAQIFKVKSDSPIPENLPRDITQQLIKVKSCIQMIQNKNGIESKYITGKLNIDTSEVTIVLFNGTHGSSDNKVDSENKKIIKLLNSFDAKVYKAPFAYSYWSKSHVIFPYEKIESVINSLILLEDIPVEPRMMARC